MNFTKLKLLLIVIIFVLISIVSCEKQDEGSKVNNTCCEKPGKYSIIWTKFSILNYNELLVYEMQLLHYLNHLVLSKPENWRCPEPNDEIRCIWCHDECTSDYQCSPGYKCCCQPACGNWCMKATLHASNYPQTS